MESRQEVPLPAHKFRASRETLKRFGFQHAESPYRRQQVKKRRRRGLLRGPWLTHRSQQAPSALH
jgi:hypothetical protein